MTKRILPILFIIVLLFVGVVATLSDRRVFQDQKPTYKSWDIQSVDTMKYSRDASREKLHDLSFDEVIDRQVKNIADLGATHVAISTPYDEEFFPILSRWVRMARKYNLNVWFRGNMSGWEEWFGYPSMDRDEHKRAVVDFIQKHPEIFEDGDIFSSCPECENGGPGDPRLTGDTQGFRNFIVEEYRLTKQAFERINKKVESNYFSMNGDVANLIMDRETTRLLDGIVVIDHYVKTPQKLAEDIVSIAEKSGGRVVLGEFGAPIPDIHGPLTEEQQAEWLMEAFDELSGLTQLKGMNYWVSVGGSTQLWNYQGEARKAASVLAEYYSPTYHSFRIVNEIYRPIDKSYITIFSKNIEANNNGNVSVALPEHSVSVIFSAPGYHSQTIDSTKLEDGAEIILKKEREGLLFSIARFFISFGLAGN